MPFPVDERCRRSYDAPNRLKCHCSQCCIPGSAPSRRGGVMEPRRSLTLLRLGVAACVIGLVSACSNAGTPTVAPTTAAATTTPATAAPPTPAPTDTPPDQVTGSLNVLDWTGYDAEWAWQDFKNKYKNVSVTFDFGDSDAAQYGKMKGGSQAD